MWTRSWSQVLFYDKCFRDVRYDYKTGIDVNVRGGSQSVSAPLGTLPMHVRGGYVIPTQDPASNTVASRLNPFGLIIALNDTNQASGSLYWDGGDSLNPIGSNQYTLFRFYAANVSRSYVVGLTHN